MTPCAFLLTSIVRRPEGDRVVEIAREAGSAESTVFMARGFTSSRLLSLLFLGDTNKEVTLTIAPPEKMALITAALRASPDLGKKVPGIAFTIDITSLIRSGLSGQCLASGDNMTPSEYVLICAITNSGYAYDIMHAAREAGARGGTVINARGMAASKDSRFFGITIVPEKELIIILSPSGEAPPIMDAIRDCPFFSEEATGIMFSLPVSEFFLLGKK